MNIIIILLLVLVVIIIAYLLFSSDKENVEYKNEYERKNQSKILNNRKKEREAIVDNLIRNLSSDDTLNDEEVSKIIDKISSTVKETTESEVI